MASITGFFAQGGTTSGGSGRSSSGNSYLPVWGDEKTQPSTKKVNRKKTVTVQGTPDKPPAFEHPTSQFGIQCPYLIGTQRIFSPNLLWYGNRKDITETKIETKKSKETKTETEPEEQPGEDVWSVLYGLPPEDTSNQPKKTTETTTTTTTVTTTVNVVGYTIDMQLGLCLGPGVKLLRIRENGVHLWEGSAGAARESHALATAGDTVAGPFAFGGGNFNQAADPLAKAGTPGYVGIAYCILQNVRASSDIGKIDFDVARFPNPLSLSTADNVIGQDVNCATAMIDFLTSDWGGAAIPIGAFDTPAFISAAHKFAAENNACSLYIQQDTTGLDVMSILQKQTGSIVFQHPMTGKITIRVVRQDDYDIDNLPIFDPSNIIDVRSFAKEFWPSIPNELRGEFTNRADDYKTNPLVAQNLAAVSSPNRPKNTASADYPAVMVASLAAALLSRDLAQASRPIPSITLATDRSGAALIPGDAFRLTWPPLGLELFPVVVNKRRDLPLSDNQSILVVEPLVLPDIAIVYAAPEPSEWEPDPSGNPAGPDGRRVITADLQWQNDFGVSREAYSEMGVPPYSSGPYSTFDPREPEPEGIVLVKPANKDQLDFSVWTEYAEPLNPSVSDDKIVKSDGHVPYAAYGKLAAPLARSVDFSDTTDQIGPLNLTDGVIPSQFLRGGGEKIWIFLGNEILWAESYAYNKDTGAVTFSSVRRAQRDTVPSDHDTGDECYFVGVMRNDYIPIVGQVYNLPAIVRYYICPNTYGKNGKPGDASTITIEASEWNGSDRRNARLQPRKHLKINGTRQYAALDVSKSGPKLAFSWDEGRGSEISRKRSGDGKLRACSFACYLVDSTNTKILVARTLPKYFAVNSFNAAIPSSAALGLGKIYVEVEDYKPDGTLIDTLPLQRDYLAVNVIA